ncbi:MAG: hypothetical protein QM808_11085 [Steroidobacteraceae bacterium]
MTLPTPEVGDWYQGRDGKLFEVVALDADDQTIEVQYFDGSLEEFDNSDWLSLSPEAAEAPEDWTGPLDVDAEDYEDESDHIMTPTWLGNGQLDRDEVSGYSEWPVAGG